jgi:hypothetical protein
MFLLSCSTIRNVAAARRTAIPASCSLLKRPQFVAFRINVIHQTSFSRTAIRMSGTDSNTQKEKKSYHNKATGAALATVKKHSKEHNLKLYGGCFW